MFPELVRIHDATAQARGEECLFERRLLRGLRSGEIIDRPFTRFAFHPTGNTTCSGASILSAMPAPARMSAWRKPSASSKSEPTRMVLGPQRPRPRRAWAGP